MSDDEPRCSAVDHMREIIDGKCLSCGAPAKESATMISEEDERIAEEREEDQREEKRRSLRERQNYIAPQCCAVMKRCKAIVATSNRPDNEPRWYLRLRRQSGDYGGVFDSELHEAEQAWLKNRTTQPFVPAPTHCPFCGTSVPTFVRKAEPPSPLAADDGGGYCKTCGERVADCLCWRPWHAWYTVGEAVMETIARPTPESNIAAANELIVTIAPGITLDEAYDRRIEFHRLWSTSVGAPGYDKSKWRELDARFTNAMRNTLGQGWLDRATEARKR